MKVYDFFIVDVDCVVDGWECIGYNKASKYQHEWIQVEVQKKKNSPWRGWGRVVVLS